MSSKYKRVLLKISGEALLGDQEFGISQIPVEDICKEINENTFILNIVKPPLLLYYFT